MKRFTGVRTSASRTGLPALSLAFGVMLAAGVSVPAEEDRSIPATPESVTDAKTITPAHVLQRVTLLRSELELIRLEMGKPVSGPPPAEVDQAAPREVYFQALALYTTADRLAFEHTHMRVEAPPPPQGTINPASVHGMVSVALERLRVVKASLRIPEQSELPPLEPGIEPSQVFNAILAANRQLNRLLDRPVGPGDVYEQVTAAIAYAARLLDTPEAVSTPPPPPPLERRKRPVDVYRRLAECFGEISAIGERVGVPVLTLKIREDRADQVEPSDVYHLATGVVSELAHLHAMRPGAAAPRASYPPGRKLPSQVYQRLGILCQQMEVLRRRVDEDPEWLTR